MNNDRPSIGSRLAALRIAKGYTIQQAARYAKPPLTATQAQAIEDGFSTFAACKAYAAGMGKWLRMTGVNGHARKLNFDVLVEKTKLDVRTVVHAVQCAMNPEGAPTSREQNVRNVIGIETDSPSTICIQSLERVLFYLSPDAAIVISDY